MKGGKEHRVRLSRAAMAIIESVKGLKIRLVKLGSKTLVDVAYSQPFFDNLPEAKIKLDKRGKQPTPVEAA
jgi:hypothetical protein